MRHFEGFEIENMLNSTGGFWLKLRCRLHLRHCPICRKRMEDVIEENLFAHHLKGGVERLISRGMHQGFVPDEVSR